MLQLVELLLQCGDDSPVLGFDDAVHHLRSSPVNLSQLPGHRLFALLGLGGLIVPQVAEDSRRHIEQLTRRGEAAQQLPERGFDFIAGDRLAVAGASRLPAQVVGVMLPLRPLGVVRGHGAIAVGAADEAAQCKGLIYVQPRRSADLAVQPFLNARICLETDKGFMLGLPHAYAPISKFQHSGVKRLGQHNANPLNRYRAPLGLREKRLRFEKPFHFRLRFEPPAREAFESFGDYRSDWLVAVHHPTATGSLIELVALWFSINPIAVLRTSAHAVDRLFLVLLSLVLGCTRQHIFHEMAVGGFAKHMRGRFQNPARRYDGIASFPECHDIASKAGKIVDDDDMGA